MQIIVVLNNHARAKLCGRNRHAADSLLEEIPIKWGRQNEDKPLVRRARGSNTLVYTELGLLQSAGEGLSRIHGRAVPCRLEYSVEARITLIDTRGGFMRSGKYESSDKSSAGTAITFLMIGIGAGALVALMLAPKSGKQLRRDIRRTYDDARDTLQDWSEDAIDRVNDVVDRSTEWAEELREVAREKTAPIAKAMKRD